MMPNTPKTFVWSRLMDECVIVTPDDIPDIANVNAEIAAGRARRLTDAEFDSWLKAKIGVDLATLTARVSETRFLSMQEARGVLLALKGEGLRETVDVGGLRFYIRQVSVT
jgi:Ni,Fe-hydrogenase III component G